MRVSESNITHLEDNEVFVFGSNESGIHGAGAALCAEKWGATLYKGEGHYGQTYAIPTKNRNIIILSLDKIKIRVDRFIEYAKSRPELKFLVTKIGCGYAKYTPKDIAPLFKEAINVENIYLPQEFWDVLNEE